MASRIPANPTKILVILVQKEAPLRWEAGLAACQREENYII
jgi:hypothetical protein